MSHDTQMPQLKYYEFSNCHICHKKHATVYSRCGKNLKGHAFCAIHLSKLGLSVAEIEANPSIFECPACSGSCPCASCQRRALGISVVEEVWKNKKQEREKRKRAMAEASFDLLDQAISQARRGPSVVVPETGLRATLSLNDYCHMCHNIRPQVYSSCTRSRGVHRFCIMHIEKYFGIVVPRPPPESIYFPACFVCSHICPCKKCESRKMKKKQKASPILVEDLDSSNEAVGNDDETANNRNEDESKKYNDKVSKEDKYKRLLNERLLNEHTLAKKTLNETHGELKERQDSFWI